MTTFCKLFLQRFLLSDIIKFFFFWDGKRNWKLIGIPGIENVRKWKKNRLRRWIVTIFHNFLAARSWIFNNISTIWRRKRDLWWYINCFLSIVSLYKTIFLLSRCIVSRLNCTTLSGNKEMYVVSNRRRRRKEKEKKKEKELPTQKLWKFPISLLALFLSRSIHSFVNINALSSCGTFRNVTAPLSTFLSC